MLNFRERWKHCDSVFQALYYLAFWVFPGGVFTSFCQIYMEINYCESCPGPWPCWLGVCKGCRWGMPYVGLPELIPERQISEDFFSVKVHSKTSLPPSSPSGCSVPPSWASPAPNFFFVMQHSPTELYGHNDEIRKGAGMVRREVYWITEPLQRVSGLQRCLQGWKYRLQVFCHSQMTVVVSRYRYDSPMLDSDA